MDFPGGHHFIYTSLDALRQVGVFRSFSSQIVVQAILDPEERSQRADVSVHDMSGR
jgi:hypothetical protein